jgi:hypothetical protein
MVGSFRALFLLALLAFLQWKIVIRLRGGYRPHISRAIIINASRLRKVPVKNLIDPSNGSSHDLDAFSRRKILICHDLEPRISNVIPLAVRGTGRGRSGMNFRVSLQRRHSRKLKLNWNQPVRPRNSF